MLHAVLSTNGAIFLRLFSGSAIFESVLMSALKVVGQLSMSDLTRYQTPPRVDSGSSPGAELTKSRNEGPP